MNTRDDTTITRTNAIAFEAPTLVPIGDADTVVLGLPWAGDDYVGFTPWPFEFEEDDDEDGAEDGAPRQRSVPG